MKVVANEEGVAIINTNDIFSKVHEQIMSDDAYRKSICARYPDSFRDDENYLMMFYMDYVHPTRFANYLIAKSIADMIPPQ